MDHSNGELGMWNSNEYYFDLIQIVDAQLIMYWMKSEAFNQYNVADLVGILYIVTKP